MPIRINLLSEALAEDDLRQRDPVKRAIFIGFFLVALSLVWLSSSWLEYKMALQNKNLVDIEIDSHTNECNQVVANLKKIQDCQHRLDKLLQLNTNRFLQGTFLNALQQVYVPNIQLMRIKQDQIYIIKEGSEGRTNAYGVVAGRAASGTERISLTLDVKDSSPNLDQTTHYKESLAALAYFKTNLDPTNGLKLSNVSSPQVSMGSKPFVLFTLECRFPDKTR